MILALSVDDDSSLGIRIELPLVEPLHFDGSEISKSSGSVTL